MTETPDQDSIREFWQETFDRMNDEVADAIDANLDAQTRFVDAWLDAAEEATSEDAMTGAVEGYRGAYEVWMEASEEAFDRSIDALQGEDVRIEDVRDIWLNAANQSFKELMGTSAFAAMTGQSVEEALDLRRQVEEATEETLHELGLPAKGDVEEVGDRIVELERRQHAVERKLDELLEAVEER